MKHQVLDLHALKDRPSPGARARAWWSGTRWRS